MYWFTIKFSFQTFSKISLYFSNDSSSFIKKDINLVSSKFFHILSFLGEMYIKVKIFNIFVANEIFKSLFTKRDLIGYCHFINIYIFYWNRFFMLAKLLLFDFSMSKFYTFFHFYICFQKFIYFLFSVFIYSFKNLHFLNLQISFFIYAFKIYIFFLLFRR